MTCFLAAGAMDIAGVAANWMKADYGLGAAVSGLVPAAISIWFLLVPLPSVSLMAAIGKRNTLLCSLSIMAAGMAAALFNASLPLMFVSLALIGMGSTMLVVSLNPFTASVLPANLLASGLTAGQSLKAMSGILAPLAAGAGAVYLSDSHGPGWRFTFLLYIPVIALAMLMLMMVRRDTPDTGRTRTSLRSLRLLGRGSVLLTILAVICHVGSDSGINFVLPQLFMERLGLPLERAGFGISIYFFSRLAGALAGIWILRRTSLRKAFLPGIVLLAAGILMAFFAHGRAALCISVILMGLGNANICTIIISQAFLAMPGFREEISALTTMALSGGALFPFLAGFAADHAGMNGSLAVISAAVIATGTCFAAAFRKA